MSATDAPRLRKPWPWLAAAVTCVGAAFTVDVRVDDLRAETAALGRDHYEILASENDRIDRMTRERAEPLIGPVVEFYGPRDGDDPVDSAVEALGAYLADAWRSVEDGDYEAYEDFMRFGPVLADLYYEAGRGLARADFLGDSYSQQVAENERRCDWLVAARDALVALVFGFAVAALWVWCAFGG